MGNGGHVCQEPEAPEAKFSGTAQCLLLTAHLRMELKQES
jgi:hypothetical protein